MNGVVPLRMERVSANVEGADFVIADLDALLVDSLIKDAFDLQSLLGGGRRDQLDDGGAAVQRFTTPILRDVAEETVLNLVPLDVPGG